MVDCIVGVALKEVAMLRAILGRETRMTLALACQSLLTGACLADDDRRHNDNNSEGILRIDTKDCNLCAAAFSLALDGLVTIEGPHQRYPSQNDFYFVLRITEKGRDCVIRLQATPSREDVLDIAHF